MMMPRHSNALTSVDKISFCTGDMGDHVEGAQEGGQSRNGILKPYEMVSRMNWSDVIPDQNSPLAFTKPGMKDVENDCRAKVFRVTASRTDLIVSPTSTDWSLFSAFAKSSASLHHTI